MLSSFWNKSMQLSMKRGSFQTEYQSLSQHLHGLSLHHREHQVKEAALSFVPSLTDQSGALLQNITLSQWDRPLSNAMVLQALQIWTPQSWQAAHQCEHCRALLCPWSCLSAICAAHVRHGHQHSYALRQPAWQQWRRRCLGSGGMLLCQTPAKFVCVCCPRYGQVQLH